MFAWDYGVVTKKLLAHALMALPVAIFWAIMLKSATDDMKMARL